jgi:hypothetical protein
VTAKLDLVEGERDPGGQLLYLPVEYNKGAPRQPADRHDRRPRPQRPLPMRQRPQVQEVLHAQGLSRLRATRFEAGPIIRKLPLFQGSPRKCPTPPAILPAMIAAGTRTHRPVAGLLHPSRGNSLRPFDPPAIPLPVRRSTVHLLRRLSQSHFVGINSIHQP